MKKSLVLASLSAVVMLTFLLSACGTKNTPQPATNIQGQNATGKYIPPITLTACSFLGPHVKFADGESLENNIWTKAYEDKLGIKLKYTFTSPDFNTFDVKVNMAIASDSLPDIIPCYSTLFFRAVDSGKCADLTEAYNKYILKEIKDLMNMNGGIALKSASKNGKLYGLASPPGIAAEMLWLRTDWLARLNLQPPKNMDEVMKIAEAFTNNDPDGNGEKDTFGIAIDKDLKGIQGFANGYHAYMNIWVEKDGKLERGEIQPEMKTALSKLAELYQAGAIDEEFVLKTPEDLKQDYGSQALGMVFANYTAPDGSINQAVKCNTGAEWDAFPIPSCDSAPALFQSESRVLDFFAVNAKCKYPEAIMKLANLQYMLQNDTSPESQAYHDKDGIDTFWYPIVRLSDPDYNFKCHVLDVEALKTGNTSKLNGEQLGYYNRMKAWIDHKNPEGWGMYKIFGPDSSLKLHGELLDKKLYYLNRGWGPETPSWKENGPNLIYKEVEYFSNIIIGASPVEDFDNWVKYFNENGGAKVTEEVNHWYRNEGKLPNQ